MTVSIACISGKGGVGKTTTTISLAAALGELDKRVLVVDCDPQSNLTSGLGLNPYSVERSLSDVLCGRVDTPLEAVVSTPWQNLSLLPATPALTAVESDLPSALRRELALRDAMGRNGTHATYDFILYDTPPSFGFHTINAMAASDYVLIPVQMSGYSLTGLKEVLRAVHLARRDLNPELRILGMVPTFVNLRTRFSRQLLSALCELASIRVFDSVITPTVKMQETSLLGVPITVHASSSKAAAAYRQLATEVLACV